MIKNQRAVISQRSGQRAGISTVTQLQGGVISNQRISGTIFYITCQDQFTCIDFNRVTSANNIDIASQRPISAVHGQRCEAVAIIQSEEVAIFGPVFQQN